MVVSIKFVMKNGVLGIWTPEPPGDQEWEST